MPSPVPTCRRGSARRLAAYPADDPRHLDSEQLATVLAARPGLEAAGELLAAGGVPLCLDHADLFPRNVFQPRGAAEPYRFFDFAESAWSHSFGSLVMIGWELMHRWQLEVPDDSVDFSDPRIRAVFDPS